MAMVERASTIVDVRICWPRPCRNFVARAKTYSTQRRCGLERRRRSRQNDSIAGGRLEDPGGTCWSSAQGAFRSRKEA